MNDIVKLIIDHLMSWPIATLAICLIFQSPIRVLIGEIASFVRRASQLSVTHKDTTVEAISDASLQAKQGAGDSAESDLGPGSAISVGKASGADDVTAERNAVRDYGKGVASVAYREQFIKSELERLGFTASDAETTEVLVRQLATQLCVSHFERVYRLIFGSQISALDLLNTSGPLLADVIKSIFFTTAGNFEPDFYQNFTFEQWLSFLVASSLVAREDDTLRITVVGRDFLVWTVNAGLSQAKPH
jgi:hypothetical protein